VEKHGKSAKLESAFESLASLLDNTEGIPDG